MTQEHEFLWRLIREFSRAQKRTCRLERSIKACSVPCSTPSERLPRIRCRKLAERTGLQLAFSPSQAWSRDANFLAKSFPGPLPVRLLAGSMRVQVPTAGDNGRITAIQAFRPDGEPHPYNISVPSTCIRGQNFGKVPSVPVSDRSADLHAPFCLCL